MRDLRIVFMGTPEFATTILKGLLDSGKNIVGVITAPDKPAGRGRKLNQSSVKKFTLENDLKVLQPTNLKSESFIEELKSLNVNLQVVVAFRMLPRVVWEMPIYGTFNLHASLLPHYRGAAPINWAIINGETKTGVTTFFIDDKIDTGEIILQDEVIIKPNETVGKLHDVLMNTGSELVIKTVNLIMKDNVSTTKQPQIEDKFAPKLNPNNCKIDWNKKVEDIYNLIRGLNPYPAAWSEILNGKEKIQLKIYDVDYEKCEHRDNIKTVITNKKKMKVAVKDGYLVIHTLKLAGKRKMDIKSLLNGYTFHSNAQML